MDEDKPDQLFTESRPQGLDCEVVTVRIERRSKPRHTVITDPAAIEAAFERDQEAEVSSATP